jgi:hypothetical protein
LYKSQDPAVVIDFMTRLNFCLDNKLVPFLHEHINKQGMNEIIITADIFSEIKRSGREIMSLTHLEDLAKEIGFEECQRKVNDQQRRVIAGTRQQFTDFLEGIVTE